MLEIGQFPTIKTERLLLTLPPPETSAQLLAYAIDNREHLAPWSPPRPDDYYTAAYWQDRLQLSRTEFMRGESLRLVLFKRENPLEEVVGECNFTSIARGPFQACYLGYNLDRRGEGQGLMREALRAAIDYVFSDLKLHRIMANYMPANERSARLLRRLGFTVEGYARDYLFIAGQWRDHILTSLTNDRVRENE
jgi:[ribosomal protein S5]-alanine N-acetyltransferase